MQGNEESIATLANPRVVYFKPLNREFYGRWEKEVEQQVAKRVMGDLAKATPEISKYLLIVAPSQGMRSRAGRVLVAGVICPYGQTNGCRNRNFWGTPDIGAVEMADLVYKNTILDRPEVETCKYKSQTRRSQQ